MPVDELLELMPTLTRRYLRNLFKNDASASAATSMCEKAGLDINFIKTDKGATLAALLAELAGGTSAARGCDCSLIVR